VIDRRAETAAVNAIASGSAQEHERDTQPDRAF
jgi:hypothetical protein